MSHETPSEKLQEIVDALKDNRVTAAERDKIRGLCIDLPEHARRQLPGPVEGRRRSVPVDDPGHDPSHARVRRGRRPA